MGDTAIKVMAFPVRVVVTLFKHPRYLILVAVIVFAIMGIKACNTAFADNPTVELPEYQKSAPEDGLDVIQTSSRMYYARDYTDDGKVITLNEYYTYDSDKWQKSSVPLPLDRDIYGEIKVFEYED